MRGLESPGYPSFDKLFKVGSNTLQMLVERDLRLSQCAKRLEVVTLLLKIAPVEAAEDSRQVLGPTSSSAVGQVTLGVQEIDAQDAVENFAAAAIPTRKRRGYVAVLGDHVGVEPRRIKHSSAAHIHHAEYRADNHEGVVAPGQTPERRSHLSRLQRARARGPQ